MKETMIQTSPRQFLTKMLSSPTNATRASKRPWSPRGHPLPKLLLSLLRPPQEQDPRQSLANLHQKLMLASLLMLPERLHHLPLPLPRTHRSSRTMTMIRLTTARLYRLFHCPLLMKPQHTLHPRHPLFRIQGMFLLLLPLRVGLLRLGSRWTTSVALAVVRQM